MKKVLAVICGLVLLIVLLVVVVIAPTEQDLCAPNGDNAGTSSEFAWPTDKEATQLTSPFGPRWGTFHNGVDLAGLRGTPIYAFADGRVIAAQDSGVQGFGGWVVLDHTIDGQQIQTVYGHSEPGQVHVKVGDKVSKGDHIADIGSAGQSTGPHLHFEVVEGDRAHGGKQVDPQPWLDRVGKPGSGVLVVGDSITNGAREEIEAEIPGAVIRAKDSQQWAAGMQELDDAAQFTTVVMALGTNGAVSKQQLDAAKDKIGNARLVLMTIAGVDHAESFNAMVKASGYDYFDWASAVKPELLTDHVHPNSEGQKVFAQTLAAALGKTATSGGAGTKTHRGAPSSQPADVEGGFAGLNGRQLALAKQIVAIGEAMGISKKGQIIAVATAKHESQLQVWANDGSGAYQSAGASGATPEELRKSLEYPHDAVGHDHASVGTFQQQVGFWGTVEELMNPAIQAKNFYERLRKVDYESGSVGAIASQIQGNATGTGVYAREEAIATQIVERFQGAGKELSAEEIEALGAAGTVTDPCAPHPNDGGDAHSHDDGLGEAILDAARRQFGQPYVWGGGNEAGPTAGTTGGAAGFDCSGLVLYAVAQATNGKIVLPHYTGEQMRDSRLKQVSWEDRKPGDLIFTGGQEPNHVGIYSGDRNGKPMWAEAQTSGVPSGEYPVRDQASAQVYRVQNLGEEKT